MLSDEHFMKEAYKQALYADQDGEIPIGCVITLQNKIIARGYNQVEKLNDSTAHAEMIAMTAAQHYLGSKYLNECTLYSTVEPCYMCAGACGCTHIGKIVYGASDPRRIDNSILTQLLHPNTVIIKNIFTEPCEVLVTNFFKKLRK